MRQMKSLAVVLAVAFLIGCASQSTVAYKTLSALQVTTSAAYAGYLDLVVTGQIKTNSVPTVSRDYTLYLAAWNAAVSIASKGTNAPATAPVADAAAKVVSDISLAKGGAL